MKQKILYLFSVIVGIVFIVSGLGKVVNTTAFGNLIVQYGLGGLQIFAPIIAICEIAVGVCFILKIRLKIFGLISVFLLLIFTAAFTYGHFKSGITDCGCFGAFKFSHDSVVPVYVRNIFLLSLSFFVWLQYPENLQNKITDSKKMILLGVLLPAIFFAGLTYQIPEAFQSKQSHNLLNKNIKETPLNQYIQTVSDTSYLVFFYSYTCPHCWNSLENLKQFKISGKVDDVGVFAIVNADSSENSETKNAFIKNLEHLENREIVYDDVVRSFIRSVPTSFYVKNDTIKAVIESTLPHPYIFKIRP